MTDTSSAVPIAAIARWRQWPFARRLMLAVAVIAVLAGAATFLVLTGTAGPGITQDTLLVLLVVDVAIVLCLGGLVGYSIVKLWAERRAGAVGARLHVRLVTLFSVVAVAPAIMVAVMAALFFNFEVKSWFNERVRAAVDNSVAVAEGYLREHKQVIAGDAVAMANDLYRIWPAILSSSGAAERAVDSQAALRSLSEAVVFDSTGRVLARTGLALESEPPPGWALDRASGGELVILTGNNDDRVRALIGLNTVPRAFLYVTRFIDPTVLRHLERTRQAATEYNRLEALRGDLQVMMAGIFVAFALLILFAAITVGLGLANRLARPISRLIAAAEQVRAGDLDVRVTPSGDEPELGSLMRSFNRMTEQLSQQHRELTGANRQLEDRRRFTETVLAGVSAGVLGLDAEGRVTLPNRSAATLLGLGRGELAGRSLDEAVPEMADLLDAARKRPDRRVEDQVTVRRDGETRTLLVRIAAERGDDDAAPGYVVTFDDITELESAQRKAAWADVARRIAHEIRNPLTPIQLSAERLKRKYAGEVTSDRATFEQYTDTIVRQVGDIRRMVDEFSAFARMPQPEPTMVDLRTLARDGVFVQRTAHPEVRFVLRLPESPVMCRCDARLVAQAITNLLQNAVEAIEGREGDVPPGEIVVSLSADAERIALAIEDNGRGLPVAERARLTEPYVTTRAKGTGLGLAIVKKIVEDHGGRLILEDRGAGAVAVEGAAGAHVVLTFPLPPTGEKAPAAQARPAAE